MEDPGQEAPGDVLLLIVPPEKASDEPTYVEIYFEQCVPKQVNGRELPPDELVMELNELGVANGIGIVDMVKNRLVGIKSRGVYETSRGHHTISGPP